MLTLNMDPRSASLVEQRISSHAVCVAILALAPWSEESFHGLSWVSSSIGEAIIISNSQDFCKHQVRSHVANPWNDAHHLCFESISYLLLFHCFGGGRFSSAYSYLPSVLRRSLWLLLVFGCCTGLIVPREGPFCPAEGHEEGEACPWAPALPPVVFSLCACVLLLSVTDTWRYTVSHASAHVTSLAQGRTCHSV